MKIELEQKLADRFVFMNGRDYSTGEPNNLPIFCECGSGWYDLIYNLCLEIEESYINTGNKDELLLLRVDQVKEKFGELRFYTGNEIYAVSDIVSKYEDLSHNVCELCGKAGTMRNDGWMVVLCDECIEKRRKVWEGK